MAFQVRGAKKEGRIEKPCPWPDFEKWPFVNLGEKVKGNNPDLQMNGIVNIDILPLTVYVSKSCYLSREHPDAAKNL
jgi:hypothetical protein